MLLCVYSQTPQGASLSAEEQQRKLWKQNPQQKAKTEEKSEKRQTWNLIILVPHPSDRLTASLIYRSLFLEETNGDFLVL